MKVCLVSNSQDNKEGKRQEIQNQGQFPRLLDYSKHLMVIKSFSCIIHFIWKLQPFKWGILCLHNLYWAWRIKKMLFFLSLKNNKINVSWAHCLSGHRREDSEVGSVQSGLHSSLLMLFNLRPLLFWASISPEWAVNLSWWHGSFMMWIPACFQRSTGEPLMYFL